MGKSKGLLKRLAEICFHTGGEPMDVRFNHGAKRNIFLDFVTFMDSFSPSEVTAFRKEDANYLYVDRHEVHFYTYADSEAVEEWSKSYYRKEGE